MVFALKKKSPPSAAILFSFANLRLPGNLTEGLREVKTSRKLPGKLPGKLTGSKITGASRNTRKVYGNLTGDLPGPIIYRVFRETGPRFEPRGPFLERPGDQFLFLWNRVRFRQVGLGSKTTPESTNQHQIGPNPLVCSNYCRARSF